MNTVKSFWLGWGSVTLAGAGAYYFAKKEINKDRQVKLEQHRARIQANRSMEDNIAVSGSPAQEASADPAATRHAPSTEGEATQEKSKFEAHKPFVSRKGDRFS